MISPDDWKEFFDDTDGAHWWTDTGHCADGCPRCAQREVQSAPQKPDSVSEDDIQQAVKKLNEI